jgi:NTP pyrophosphatase (non-canonical NTP hydrolase)
MEYANDKYFHTLLQREVQRARSKHPINFDLFIALVEEIGEVARAIQEHDTANLLEELVQVACVAMRLATEGDMQHRPARDAARLLAEKNIKENAVNEQ